MYKTGSKEVEEVLSRRRSVVEVEAAKAKAKALEADSEWVEERSVAKHEVSELSDPFKALTKLTNQWVSESVSPSGCIAAH